MIVSNPSIAAGERFEISNVVLHHVESTVVNVLFEVPPPTRREIVEYPDSMRRHPYRAACRRSVRL